MRTVTKEEQRAINALHRLAARWPKTLWIYCEDGTLHVAQKDKYGYHAITSRGDIDQGYILDRINIESECGSC